MSTVTATDATDSILLATDADGVIRVRGTRVTLDTVIAAYQQGSSPEQIAQDYSVLQAEDVSAVIAYYLTHRDQVDEYLRRRNALAETVRRELEQRFPSKGLRERLMSRLRSKEGSKDAPTPCR
jgi:uncharacterized protein (DUF433 family)